MTRFVLNRLFQSIFVVVGVLLLECLSQEYVRTARAKGVAERVILAKHVMKNAMMPVVTAWALDVANLFGGAVITESIFGWPGLGRLVVESVTFRDFPTDPTLRNV